MDFLDLDLNLTEEDIALRKSTHKFAREVMRPIAKQLDEMSPREVIAPESPFWDFMRQGYQLGYHKLLIPEPYGMGLTSLQQTIVPGGTRVGQRGPGRGPDRGLFPRLHELPESATRACG